MNKIPQRPGPKIRITKPALRKRKLDEPQQRIPDPRTLIFTCEFCRVKFSSNKEFFLHMMSNHQMQQSQALFQCNYCQLFFNKKVSLDIHLQNQHKLRSQLKCDSCSVTFKSRYCLQRHKKLKQSLLEHTCKKCHKKCVSKEHLLKHMKNRHMSKNVTHQCDLCNRKFKNKSSLETHIKRLHRTL